MGVLRSMQSHESEVEELRGMLVRSGIGGGVRKSSAAGVRRRKNGLGGDGGDRMVCVTSGISFLGFAIVNRLLSRGYNVRLALETQEDLEKVRKMEIFGEIERDGVTAVMAAVADVDSLCRAFEGCSAVFHTSAFVDPSGVSGYSKHMAGLEVRAAERVVEACVRTESVRKCVFTSSLLSCIWRQDYSPDSRPPTIIDENCWSDEALCRDKKLWFALGKMMAEKAAWRTARGRNLKLATVCTALITGPGFSRRNSTGSIAYLKGAQEMLQNGLLATVDVEKAAEAHVSVYEAMADTACGRYLCFDHVIRRPDEAAQLGRQLGLPNRISTTTVNEAHPARFELCDGKLSRLFSASSLGCTYDTYSFLY